MNFWILAKVRCIYLALIYLWKVWIHVFEFCLTDKYIDQNDISLICHHIEKIMQANI